MARNPKKQRKDDDRVLEERLFAFLTVSYVLHVVGLLPPGHKEQLDSVSSGWIEHVEKTLGFNTTFVRSVYALCTEHRTHIEAVCFILRGLKCRDYFEILKDVLGYPGDDGER